MHYLDNAATTVVDPQLAKICYDTMLELFHAMGCQVVAEGVETSLQAQAITAKGADWIQGYYYARPMPPEELADFFRRREEMPEEQ